MRFMKLNGKGFDIPVYDNECETGITIINLESFITKEDICKGLNKLFKDNNVYSKERANIIYQNKDEELISKSLDNLSEANFIDELSDKCAKIEDNMNLNRIDIYLDLYRDSKILNLFNTDQGDLNEIKIYIYNYKGEDCIDIDYKNFEPTVLSSMLCSMSEQMGFKVDVNSLYPGESDKREALREVDDESRLGIVNNFMQLYYNGLNAFIREEPKSTIKYFEYISENMVIETSKHIGVTNNDFLLELLETFRTDEFIIDNYLDMANTIMYSISLNLGVCNFDLMQFKQAYKYFKIAKLYCRKPKNLKEYNRINNCINQVLLSD